MASRSLSFNRRRDGDAVRVPSRSYRSIRTFPAERHSERGGGIISVPRKLTPFLENSGGSQARLTKLLLNVTIERSLGAVQVVTSPENTVGDLIKAALEIYVREKRRPLLAESDAHRFDLHYSQFSLESLKADEKLINLGSRKFFLCSKPSTSSSSCSEEAKKGTNIAFPLTKLMDFLL